MLKVISWPKSLTLTGLLLLLIAGLSVHQVQAQNFSYGLKGGINLANHYEAQFEADPITTIRIGAYTNLGLGSSPFSIQPEVYYSQKGSDSNYQTGDLVFRGNFRTDYIKVPILLHYSLNLFRELQAGLFAGPSVSFLLRSKFSGPQIDIDMMEITTNTDFGVVGGIAFNSPAISDRLSMELRFSRGFSKLYEPGSNPECCGEFSRPNRNTALSILLGYAF